MDLKLLLLRTRMRTRKIVTTKYTFELRTTYPGKKKESKASTGEYSKCYNKWKTVTFGDNHQSWENCGDRMEYRWDIESNQDAG